MQVTVASTADLVAMIEAGAKEVTNEVMYDGIMKGHAENQKMVAFIEDIQKQIGKEKFTFETSDPDPAMFEAVKDFAIDDVKALTAVALMKFAPCGPRLACCRVLTVLRCSPVAKLRL